MQNDYLTPIEKREKVLNTPLKQLRFWQIWNEFSNSNERLGPWSV